MDELESYTLKELVDQCRVDSDRWFPEKGGSLVQHVLGLVGESGEVADIVKKVDRGTLPELNIATDNIPRAMLAEELTDVLIYVLNLFGLLRLDPDVCWDVKRQYNEERFGPKAETDKLHLPKHVKRNGQRREK